jgi:hypothetical protein
MGCSECAIKCVWPTVDVSPTWELVRSNRLRSGRRLADVGQFADRPGAKLLLVVDIAGSGVELVVAEQDVWSAVLSQAKNDGDRLACANVYGLYLELITPGIDGMTLPAKNVSLS